MPCNRRWPSGWPDADSCNQTVSAVQSNFPVVDVMVCNGCMTRDTNFNKLDKVKRTVDHRIDQGRPIQLPCAVTKRCPWTH